MWIGLSLQERALLFRQLASLVGAGVPMTRALAALEGQSTGRLRRVLGEVARRIDAGSSFAQAMEASPSCFDAYAVALVRAGEAGGTLDGMLAALADATEEASRVRQQLMAALAYPLLVLHVAAVIPAVIELVLQGGAAFVAAALPNLARLWGGLALVALLGSLKQLLPVLARPCDALLLWLPLYGKVVRTRALAGFLRICGNLTEAGLPAARCLEVAAAACGNASLGGRFLRGRAVLDAGGSMLQALSASRQLASDTLTLVAVGEESGRLGGMLLKAAEYQQQACQAAMQRLMALLPTLLMLGVGAYVGKLYVQRFTAILAPLHDLMP